MSTFITPVGARIAIQDLDTSGTMLAIYNVEGERPVFVGTVEPVFFDYYVNAGIWRQEEGQEFAA